MKTRVWDSRRDCETARKMFFSCKKNETVVSFPATVANKKDPVVELLKERNLLHINIRSSTLGEGWRPSVGGTRKDRTVILDEIFTYFPLIFCRFSADGTPSAVFPPTCLQIMPISAYFCLFSAYFLPIFRLKWYPILIINSSMLPICHFSAHMFMDSTYFPLIFRLFSA